MAKMGKGGRKTRGSRKDKEDVGGVEEGPYDYYTRSDCFKVEKGLLVYG